MMANTIIQDSTLDPPVSSIINGIGTWGNDLEGGWLIEVWDISIRIG